MQNTQTRAPCAPPSTQTAVLGGCAEEITYFRLPFSLSGGFLSRVFREALKHDERRAEADKTDSQVA